VQTGDPVYPVRITIKFADTAVLRELAGELGQHLKIVGRSLGVNAQVRGQEIIVGGQDGSVELAARTLEQLYNIAATGYHLHPADVDQACRLIRNDPEAPIVSLYSDTVHVGVKDRQIHPRSIRQKDYVEAIRTKDMVFGVGPAGTGKTYLAMAMGVSALFRSEVRRIILTRPAVEAGEKLGFLPGDLVEKVNPYLRPLYDALYDLVPFDKAERMVHKNVIEVAPLAFMRGRTLSDAFVILDEAQNTSPAQMKMFLTRLGMNSRAVITGDPTQIDLGPGMKSGLNHALDVLTGIEGIGVVHFSDADVVRHPLVSEIVVAYERADERRREQEAQAHAAERDVAERNAAERRSAARVTAERNAAERSALEKAAPGPRRDER
jgi:phosphate starvation-inducible protein PhoH and related proteins